MEIAQIKICNEIYPRENYDLETVNRYSESMIAGVKFPPIVVLPDLTLLDGRHRLEAHKQIGAEDIEVIIENPEDPAVRAVELNLCHGIPLTRNEMKELARKWYGTRPVTEIAKVLGVTRQTVQNWVSDLAMERGEIKDGLKEKVLEMRGQGMTQEEVAEQLRVPQQTISRWEKAEYPSVKKLTHGYFGQEHENHKDSSELESHNDQSLTSVHRGKVEQLAQENEDLSHVEIPETHNEWAGKKGLQVVQQTENTIDQARDFIELDTAEDIEIESPDENKCVDEPRQTINDHGGHEAAKAYRKKILPYSDTVKEFYYQLKKASELAEQLVNRREELIESIAAMQSDGISITVLANTAIQGCDIYLPRLTEAKKTLQEVIKPGIKGVAMRDKFMVVEGGKTNG